MHYWAQCREFYQQFRRATTTTGSILPSSRSLARALVSSVRQRRRPARILEVGPGTGPVTAEILRQLRPDDRLDIVEINPHFIDILRRRFAEEPLWRLRQPQTQLLNAPLQAVPGEAIYDYVVSGLPLNNFPLALVREIFQAFQRLLKPGGILSYFEYLAIRNLKSTFVRKKKEQRRLRVLGKFLDRRIRAYQVREQWIFLNMPPAVARHFCFDECTPHAPREDSSRGA